MFEAAWAAIWEWIVWNPGWFAVIFWIVGGGWLYLQIDKAKVLDPEDDSGF